MAIYIGLCSIAYLGKKSWANSLCSCCKGISICYTLLQERR